MKRDTFLSRIARKIMHEPQKIAETIVILPNRRSTKFLGNEIALLSNQKALLLPEILSLDDFLAKVMQIKIAEHFQQILALREVVSSQHPEFEQEPLASSFRILRAMLSQMHLLCNHLTEDYQFGELEKNLQQLSGDTLLCRLQKDFLQIMRQLEAKLAGKALSSGYFLRAACLKNFRLFADYFSGKNIYLCGFNALTPAEENFFRKIKELSETNGKCQVFWFLDFDHYFLQTGHQAGKYFHKFWKDFLPEDFEPNTELSRNNKKIVCYCCRTSVGQVRKVAKLVKSLTNESCSSDPLQTAIILPAAEVVVPLIGALDAAIPKNITMGIPLSITPAISFLKLLLQLLKEAVSDGEALLLRQNTVQKLFVHPFFGSSERSFNRKRYFPLSDLEQESEELFALLTHLFYPETEKSFSTCFLDLFNRLLQNELDPLTKATIHTLGNLIVEAEPFLQNNAFPAEQYLKLLIELVRSETVMLIGEPLKGIQIMGVLETQCLDFQNLFFLNLNEGTFPANSVATSFLPFELTKNFIKPEIQQESNVMAYHFYRLLQRAENIQLFYLEPQAKKQQEESRFIKQLKFEYPFQKSLESQSVIFPASPPKPEKISVSKNEQTLKTLKEINYSATTLYNYLSCPLKFYLEEIACLKQRPVSEDAFDAKVFGNIMHHILWAIFKKFHLKILNVNELEKEIANLEQRIEQEIRKELQLPEGVSFSGKELLLQAAITKILRNFFKQEKERIKTYQIKLTGLEKEIMTGYAFGNQQLTFRGFIDRIEECNSKITIFDYKTGSTKSLNEKKPDLRDKLQFQLYFYALLLGESEKIPVERLNLGCINLNSFKKEVHQQISCRQEDFNGFQHLLEEEILKQLFDIKIPFEQTVKKSTCRYCDFALFCQTERLAESETGTAETEENDEP